MCGIWGWIGDPPGDIDGLRSKIQAVLRHRGPDDEGFNQGNGWGLGFRRLSILDLTQAGHQPMSWADQRYWLVFNGEIYNYLELRRELEQHGEVFVSASDSEVLLRLLARHGPAALPRLNGMFAFALIDTQKRTFLLVRDRLGIKPLYYQLRPTQLRFASELKGLIAWPDADRRVDSDGLLQYLVLNYIPSETCILEGYQKIPPAHYLQGALDAPQQATLTPYWSVQLNHSPDRAELTSGQLDELEHLLHDAVRIRLRSDVPVGVFLSGGIDSGLIASLAAKEGASLVSPPLAFTVNFSEAEYDETSLASATAQSAGLPHQIIHQPLSGLGELDRLAWFFDEPFGDSSALPFFTLCKAAAKYATVFLSGDGGDEAFAGYPRYLRARRYALAAALPKPIRPTLRIVASLFPPLSLLRYRLIKTGLPDQGFAAFFDHNPLDPALSSALPPDLRSRVMKGAKPVMDRWATSRGQDLLARQQALDYALYLPDDILVKVDRASMAHSIEVRSPFLDYRLIEWAARLPRASLINDREGKLPLRMLGRRLLPSAVAGAAKRGFAVPLEQWLRQEEGVRFCGERLLADPARQLGWWDVNAVERLIKLHQNGRDFSSLLWRLLFLEAWARQHGIK